MKPIQKIVLLKVRKGLNARRMHVECTSEATDQANLSPEAKRKPMFEWKSPIDLTTEQHSSLEMVQVKLSALQYDHVGEDVDKK